MLKKWSSVSTFFGKQFMLNIFLYIANIFDYIFSYEIFGFPLLIIWLMAAALFLSFKLGFPNIRYFRHGLDVALHNKYYSPSDPGEITPRQALFTSISGSIGLGSIAGVAIAISVGGPGAIIWMIITGFFNMNTVFAETTLSQTYKKVEADGKTNGGPFRYLRYGLEDIGYRKFGTVLSKFFSFMLVFGCLGSGMFQINQAVNTVTDYSIFSNFKIILGAVFAIFAFYMLLGGVKSISKIVEKLVPAMALLYTVCAIIILSFNYMNIIPSIGLIFTEAFNPKAITGGIIGVIVMGIKRSVFSSEAGLGTTSIAHAVAKTKQPVRQAAIASLTPMITMFFCMLTALIIIATDAYKTGSEGVIMTRDAFLSVSSWFPILLSTAIVLFALSNMLSYSFYGQSAWRSFFKNRLTIVFNIIYAIAIFASSMADLNLVVQIADTFVLSMAIPNLIGVYMLSSLVKRKMKHYDELLKSGAFDAEESIFVKIFKKLFSIPLKILNMIKSIFKKG